MVSDEARRRKKGMKRYCELGWDVFGDQFFHVFPLLISSNFKQFQMTNYSWSERKSMAKRKNQEKEQRWMDQVSVDCFWEGNSEWLQKNFRAKLLYFEEIFFWTGGLLQTRPLFTYIDIH